MPSLVIYHTFPLLQNNSSFTMFMRKLFRIFQAADMKIIRMNRPFIFCTDNGSYNGCNQGCRRSTSAGLLLALFP